jgi:hypothetical protein
MISKKFLKEQMQRIENNYGTSKFNVTQPMFDLWFDIFKDYDVMGFKCAVDEYLKTNEFAPNIAGINKIYQKMVEERDITSHICKAKYKWVARWFEQKPNWDSYKAFLGYVCKYSFDKREKVAESLASKLIAYWNDCDAKGIPIEDRMTIEGFIKELDDEC